MTFEQAFIQTRIQAMKLYGLKNEIGYYYVIANDPTEAENKLLKLLDEADYGFSKSRLVKQIDVIAEAADDARFLSGKFLLP